MMTGTVLVLENDLVTRDVTLALLEESGFSTKLTTVDRVILDVLSLNPILLILDLRLQSFTTGAVICQTIRSQIHSALLPIILVSDSIQLEEHAQRCNANAYVAKPFNNTDFCKTVKDVLSF